MDEIEALKKTRNYFSKINDGNNPSVYAIDKAIQAIKDRNKYKDALLKMSRNGQASFLKKQTGLDTDINISKSIDEPLNIKEQIDFVRERCPDVWRVFSENICPDELIKDCSSEFCEKDFCNERENKACWDNLLNLEK